MSRLLLRTDPRPLPDGAEVRAFLLRTHVSQRCGEPWRHVGFMSYRLAPGGRWGAQFHDDEACIVVLGGSCAVTTSRAPAGPPAVHTRWDLGERSDPFAGPPAAVYISAGTSYEVTTEAGVEFAVGLGPASPGPAPRALPAMGARLEVRGSGAMERTIRHILMEDQPASSLLITEVITPAGHWSSYPPHKHDTDDPPRESYLEEIYYFRFRDQRGFGLMRIYTADRSLDETIAVRDGDLVLVPRGYHTFSAAPGYEAYYLNVMAGPRRAWQITFDPDHERMRW